MTPNILPVAAQMQHQPCIDHASIMRRAQSETWQADMALSQITESLYLHDGLDMGPGWDLGKKRQAADLMSRCCMLGSIAMIFGTQAAGVY